MMLVVAISAWSAETVYYTLDGTETGGTSGYATDSEITQSDMDWLVTGNTTMSPWRLGGKSLTGVDRDVKATTAMGSAITKVALEVGTKTLTSVNSIKLTVASDADFNTVLDEKTESFEASSTIEFTPTTGTEWATGAYYKFTFNVTAGSSNQYVQFVKAEFYKNEEGGETPVDPVVLTAPTFSPEAGEVESGTTVTITAPEGYYVAYTTDGSDPTQSGELSESNVATVTVTEAMTIKAATADDDLNFSEVVEAAYTIAQTTPDDPTPGGTVTVWSEDWESTDFDSAATAAVSSVQNANATYSASTGSSTKVYNSGGPNNNPNLLLAKSGNDTFTASIALNGVSGNLTLTWSQSGSGAVGSITSTVSGVTVGTISNEGTTINVPEGTTTLDLTFTNSKSSNMRIDDFLLTGTASGETPEPQVTVATPVITAEGADGQNAAGEWIDEADVTITCETEGSSIYYTTDGTAPTNQSTAWTGTPFTLTETTTVKAIAYVGETTSEVAELEVLIGEVDQETPSTYVDDEIIRSTLDFGTGTSGYIAFTTDALTSGAEYAGVAYATNTTDIQLRTSGSVEGLVSTTSGGNIRKVKVTWSTTSSTTAARKLQVYGSNSAYTAASELYSESTQGTLLGEIATTGSELEISDDYRFVGVRINSGAAYINGLTFSWEAAEAPAVEAPVITSDDEAKIGPQTISITCATEGADVYYTIDGTEPTTESTLYEAPFQVSESCTVKAIATDGTATSAVSAKVITINEATTVAEAAAMNVTDDKNKEIVLQFTDAKVIYVTSDKTFLREGDDAVLLYKLSSLGLNLNDVVSGTVKVKFSPYNNLPEWISTTGTSADALEVTASDEAAQPIPATVSEIAEGKYLCNLVKVTGVKVILDGSNYYASEDGETKLFQIRDNYGTGALSVFETTASNGARRKAEAVGGDEGFDIEGIVEVYNSTIQLAPTSATSIVTGVEDLAADKAVKSVKYVNLLGVESNEPFAGINVVVTTYTDGSKSARKVVK